MNLFHKLMTKLGRYRLIPDRRTGAEYMDRYYLLLKDRKWFPFNVTMHHIKKSDDPIFHDHPWSYLTIVISGGYREHTPVFNFMGEKFAEFSTWHGPGSVIWRKATDYHWLELEEGIVAKTIFFMGPQKRDWGFLAPDIAKKKLRWVQHEKYLASVK